MSYAKNFIKKLQSHIILDDDDLNAIDQLPIRPKDVPAHQKILREGDKPSTCILLIEGFLIRSKDAVNGRQIISVHIPGEVPDLQSVFLHTMDHDLSSLTACKLGFIDHSAVKKLIHARPNVAEALWRDTLIDASIFREWIVNLGNRSAEQRAAHIILELKSRLNIIDRDGEEFELPISQEELGDIIGTTAVHANRVLKVLRDTNLVTFRKRTVKIHNLKALEELGDFDRLYLHQNPAS